MNTTYTQAEATELALNGACGYELQPTGISLLAAEIVNSRPSITSGTLSLELWALDQAL